MKEDERIARITAILLAGSSSPGRLRVGIGDDAAVLDPPTSPLVWTIDEQVEDVHFKRAWCSMNDVGYRATMAAASDLAAMGARPLGALAAIVVPPDVTDEDLAGIARGQREACDAIAAPVVGGNLSRGERLSVATTWLGTSERPVLRSGARVGDGVWVCGDLGLASAGLYALQAKLDDAPPDALLAWRRPTARIADGLRMAAAAVVSGAIDVSDGLARDAGHVAAASHVRIVIDEAALAAQLHAATKSVAAQLTRSAIDVALGGGEDYALLCTSSAPLDGFVRIGEVTAGEGVVLRGLDGRERSVSAGFDHFA